MTQVHAPYHFVPLSSWVYMPEWAHLVSHDHPFAEGISGVIDYELTNATPLLVGANSQRLQGQPALISWAKDPDGNPIIPGSSLKGLLRNLLEIATFSKFDRVDNHHFAYRDISTGKTRYSEQVLDSQTQAAWLSFDDNQGSWQLRYCQHTVLFSDDFNRFSGCKIINSASQTAVDKFELWPLSKTPISFSLSDRTMRGTKGQDVTVICALDLGKGELQGHPVFTGFRPGKKEYSDNRLNFNYLFYAADAASEAKAIPASNVAKMFAAHGEELVQHLKTRGHPSLGIPVFIKIKTGKTLGMGFAKMPKILYDLSIYDVAEQQQKALNSQSVFDFTDLVFGTLAESGFSLKSRVMFADAHLQGASKLHKSSPVVLGQPKASYLNAYLEQPSTADIVRGDLSQYESTSKLSGWKRYPIQQKFNAHLPHDLANKPNVQSQLELMEAGNTFKGKLVFHNLQPIELGALLWAFNPNDNDEFYHGLGHGKSLGAGAVQFTTSLSHYQANNNVELDTVSLKQLFIEHMNNVYPATNNHAQAWQNSPQIRHLLAFGNKEDNSGKNLTYMPLSSPRDSDVVSYSSSAKGIQKHVLPDWHEHNEALSRKEQLKSNPTQLGKGRLKDLIEQLQQKDQLSSFEQEQYKHIQERAKQAEKNAEKGAASLHFKTYLELAEELEPYNYNDDQDSHNKRQGNVGRVARLLDDCLADPAGASQQELQSIYDFSCNYQVSGFIDLTIKPKDLSKKARETFRGRQSKLDEFKTRFQLVTKQ